MEPAEAAPLPLAADGSDSAGAVSSKQEKSDDFLPRRISERYGYPVTILVSSLCLMAAFTFGALYKSASVPAFYTQHKWSLAALIAVLLVWELVLSLALYKSEQRHKSIEQQQQQQQQQQPAAASSEASASSPPAAPAIELRANMRPGSAHLKKVWGQALGAPAAAASASEGVVSWAACR